MGEFLLSQAQDSRASQLLIFVHEDSAQNFKETQAFCKVCFQDMNHSLFHKSTDLDEMHLDLIVEQADELDFLRDFLQLRLNEYKSVHWNKLYELGMKNILKFRSSVSALEVEDIKKLSLHQDVLLELIEFEKELFNLEAIEKCERSVRSFLKKISSKIKFKMIDPDKLEDLREVHHFLPVSSTFGVEIDWTKLEPQALLELYLVLSSLNQVILYRQENKNHLFDERLWDKLLDALPFPVALFNREGEVHQCNLLFTKLNTSPEEFRKVENRQKILIDQIPYTVFVKEIFHVGEEKKIFIFFTESYFVRHDEHHTPSSQELGIISSSIAHELNNPIAGIHSAISLLQLDPKTDAELNQILDEMKNGALRCKQLVETFLGFSRVRIQNLEPIKNDTSLINLCYHQSINLLRFRTVETGIRFSPKYQLFAELKNPSNLSLMTMAFYLIFGEIMTLFSHHQLVSLKANEKVIDVELVESSQEISLQFKSLNISSLKLSKLILNLIHMEKMSLSVSDFSLRFILNPTRDIE